MVHVVIAVAIQSKTSISNQNIHREHFEILRIFYAGNVTECYCVCVCVVHGPTVKWKVFIVFVNGFIMFPFVTEPKKLRVETNKQHSEHIIEMKENEFKVWLTFENKHVRIKCYCNTKAS